MRTARNLNETEIPYNQAMSPRISTFGSVCGVLMGSLALTAIVGAGVLAAQGPAGKTPDQSTPQRPDQQASGSEAPAAPKVAQDKPTFSYRSIS